MADFEYVSINTTAEKIEKIANMNIDDATLDENSKDNSLPTSKLVFDTIKKEVENKIDQNYSPESFNAQSGKAVAEAVAEAVSGFVPKLPTYIGPPYDNVIAVYESGEVDENGLPLDQYYKHIPIEDDSFGIQPNFIIKRGKKGTIRTEAPINDLDCANKKYVDDAVKNASGGGSADLSNYYTKVEIDAKIGDIETALDELHNYAQAIIGGAE